MLQKQFNLLLIKIDDAISKGKRKDITICYKKLYSLYGKIIQSEEITGESKKILYRKIKEVKNKIAR